MAIYALLDWDTLKKYDVSIKDFCKTAKGLKAKILQYRDKNSPLEEKKERLFEIRKYWKKPLIINDTIELLPYCDGIHIGQEDLKKLCDTYNLSAFEIIYAIKNGEWRMENGEFKIIKNNSRFMNQNSQFSILNSQFIIGLSTHNKEEILEANKLPLNYIGLGAYRPTKTKNTSNIIGEKVIDLIKFSNHPVAVIGGVKIYDKIPSKFKVIGSDICRLTSSRLRKKKIFKMK
ncbi:thiamine phosphate synthase [Nautilia lithotrophica]